MLNCQRDPEGKSYESKHLGLVFQQIHPWTGNISKWFGDLRDIMISGFHGKTVEQVFEDWSTGSVKLESSGPIGTTLW